MPDGARPFPHHVRGYLRGADAVSALLNELRRRDELLQTVRAAVPEAIRVHCKQASLRDGLLSLSVDSPVWVRRLKFLSPQLVTDLRKLAIAVDDCRVRALPESTASRSDISARATFSPSTAASHLARAADGIADQPLADSLRRLADSLSRRGVAERGPGG